MVDSEELLIQRAQRGEHEALKEIYQQYYKQIYTYIYFRVSNEAVTQDLTAEVFVRMVSHIKKYSYQQRSLLAWLYTIARNLVTDHFRANKKVSSLPLTDELMGQDRPPDDLAQQQITQQQIAQVLTRLTEEQRQVVLLRFMEGYRLHEVASQLGKSEGAIKALQHRALATLRRLLIQDFGYGY